MIKNITKFKRTKKREPMAWVMMYLHAWVEDVYLYFFSRLLSLNGEIGIAEMIRK